MEQDKIGKFIASCRKEHGMTQVQFAEKLGITNKAVSKWETGKCLPDASLFNDVCLLLDITINELFAGEKIEKENIAAKADENLLGVVSEYQNSNYHNALNASLFGIGLGMIITSAIISNTVFKIIWIIIAILTLTFGCYKLDIIGGKLLKLIKIISLVALAISFLCTVDLGINYANALLVEYHDGIVLTGILSKIIYGDSHWSLPAFFQSFNSMLIVTTIITIENIMLWCVSIAKNKWLS